MLEWGPGIFTNQGSNLGLLYYRQILYCLSYQGNQNALGQVISLMVFYY